MSVRPLSAELAKKAEIELNETPGRLVDGISHLKKWIAMQPHLEARTDDQWLAAFLRGCKHRVEQAKAKLDLYYSLRTISPDMFVLKHDDKKFKDLLKTGSLLILPKTSKATDPRVVLVRPGRYDPNKYGIMDFIALSHTCQQIMYLEDDVLTVNGTINIVDLGGITMAHFLQMTPTQMKKIAIAGQDASPLRLKGLHFVNAPAAFVNLFDIAIRFVNEKHRKKIHFYSKDISVLYNSVPRDTLPMEYGGNISTQGMIDDWLKKIVQYGAWLDEDVRCGTDESKRPGEPKTAEDMFGVDGSFRRLEVD